MFNVGNETKPADGHEAATTAEHASNSSKQSSEVIKPVDIPLMGSLGALVLIATILMIIGTGILYFLSLSKKTALRDNEQAFSVIYEDLQNGELSKLNADINEIVAGKSALGKAMGDRIYWSKFWDVLGKVTPKKVAYTTLTVGEDGTVSISGEAKDLTSVAKLMVSLQNKEEFNNVELSGTSISDNSKDRNATFSIKLSVNRKLLVD